MEMQFDRVPMAYLKKLTGQLRSQEQTLEVRLPDGMPDIGRVLGAWGQVIVRSKEWNSDAMTVSCGVMAWVLYTPEDEESVRSVEAWLPFSMKWELPDARYDGKILVSCLLRGVDARGISARKLMVRASLSALGEAWLPDEASMAVPGALPEDVELLTAEYPLLVPREAGEKAFSLEEELALPNGVRPEKLLYYSLQPEILDKKVMAGKVVFRGIGRLRLLCRGEDGKLFPLNFELPFSQYGDLEGEYDGEPTVSLCPCVTGLDLSMDENGVLQLKAGLLGQYMLCERIVVSLVEDAYSTRRTVVPIMEELRLPVVLEQTVRTFHGEQTLRTEVDQVVDTVFLPAYGQPERTAFGIRVPLPGQFQTLYYDGEGKLSGAVMSWEGEWTMDADDNAMVDMYIQQTGSPQAVPGMELSLRGELTAAATVTAGQGLPMITGMEMGEPEKPDADRPSLILCRKGDRRLWDIAKRTRSTVTAIKEANRLEGEPEENRVLLIPVP